MVVAAVTKKRQSHILEPFVHHLIQFDHPVCLAQSVNHLVACPGLRFDPGTSLALFCQSLLSHDKLLCGSSVVPRTLDPNQADFQPRHKVLIVYYNV